MEKHNETYWKRKIATRKKLCKLLDGYRLYMVENCWPTSSASRLVDCIVHIEQCLESDISVFAGQIQKEGHSIQ